MEPEYIERIESEIKDYSSEHSESEVGTPLILIAKLLVKIEHDIEGIVLKMYE